MIENENNKQNNSYTEKHEFIFDELNNNYVIELRREYYKIRLSVWNKADKEDIPFFMVGGDFCKIDPHCFSVVLLTPELLKLKASVSFYVAKVRETIDNREFDTFIISRI